MSDQDKSMTEQAALEEAVKEVRKAVGSHLSVDPEGLPRERLKRFGVGPLTNTELLSIILSSDSEDNNGLALAKEVLDSFYDIQRLSGATLIELEDIPGIEPHHAISIIAAFELGKRVTAYKRFQRDQIKSHEDVVRYIEETYRNFDTERLICLEMSQKHEILHEHIVSEGGLDGTNAHPRDLFCKLLRNRVAAFILVHNHPSGDPEPSQADITITKRLNEGATILGLRMLDHIIVGDGKHVSFKNRGLL